MSSSKRAHSSPKSFFPEAVNKWAARGGPFPGLPKLRERLQLEGELVTKEGGSRYDQHPPKSLPSHLELMVEATNRVLGGSDGS